jgi:hypothetical protein
VRLALIWSSLVHAWLCRVILTRRSRKLQRFPSIEQPTGSRDEAQEKNSSAGLGTIPDGSAGVTGAGHQPDPATYDCLSCEKPWPCDPAREYLLLSTPDLVQLNVRLWLELETAAGVLGHEPPAVLFERFLKWARREP